MNKSGGCGSLIAIFFVLGLILSVFSKNSPSSSDDKIDDIIAAKAYVRSMLNYPDTADFHEFSTEVTSTHVNLKVTAKNGFGVPTTETFSVPRSQLR